MKIPESGPNLPSGCNYQRARFKDSWKESVVKCVMNHSLLLGICLDLWASAACSLCSSIRGDFILLRSAETKQHQRIELFSALIFSCHFTATTVYHLFIYELISITYLFSRRFKLPATFDPLITCGPQLDVQRFLTKTGCLMYFNVTPVALIYHATWQRWRPSAEMTKWWSVPQSESLSQGW